MLFTITNNQDGRRSISVFLDEDAIVVPAEHPKFDEIADALIHQGDDPEATEATVRSLLTETLDAVRRFVALSDRVSIRGNKLYLDGDRLKGALAKAIVRLNKAGKDPMPLVRFLEKVLTNNTEHSRDCLFRWLKDRDFTITDDGDFIAYKGLTGEFGSINHGPGIVDGVEMNGSLPNKPGSLVEIARSAVEHNPHIGCASGLHAGTYSYASNFGRVVVAVSINPRDVVSVPTDCNDEKLRVCRYKVLKEVSSESSAPLWQEPEQPAVPTFTVGDVMTDEAWEQVPVGTVVYFTGDDVIHSYLRVLTKTETRGWTDRDGDTTLPDDIAEIEGDFVISEVGPVLAAMSV